MKRCGLLSIVCILVYAQSYAQSPNQNNTHQSPITETYHDSTEAVDIWFIDSLICYAESYLGTPYHYGSKGPNSFDCSGFTGYVFKHFHISLPASSTAQYLSAPKIIHKDSVQQGDLIFFMGRNGRKSVGHVGIVVSVDTATKSCRFIHSATHGGVIFTEYPSTAYYNQRFMDYGRYPMPTFIKRFPKKEDYSETIEKISEGE